MSKRRNPLKTVKSKVSLLKNYPIPLIDSKKHYNKRTLQELERKPCGVNEIAVVCAACNDGFNSRVIWNAYNSGAYKHSTNHEKENIIVLFHVYFFLFLH